MKKETPLTLPQLKAILGKDWDSFMEKIIPNCLCPTCNKVVTIVDFKIVVNDLNDVILKGSCAGCGDPVNRYMETGENEEYVRRIKRVKKEAGGLK
jgi:transcription initiation factor IIE alpha subunit